MKSTAWFRFIVGLMLILAVGLNPTRALAEPHAFTSDFVVINLNDSGFGSLRQAILNANAVDGENVITFTITGNINLISTLPQVGDHLIIDGGSNAITISGGDLVRMLEIQAGINVSLVSLTFANGRFSFGGAIYNQGSLRLENCRLTQNHAEDGAAIYNSGELLIFNSVFEENEAGFGGGAIWNHGQGYAEIHESVLRDNQAISDFGGALYNLGEAIVDATEISGNTAQNVGGGIINWNKLELTNSQVHNNYAKLGGGVDNTPRGSAVIRNTTITGNTTGHWGGGINNDGEMTLVSSQVSDNRGMEFGGGIYNSGVLSVLDTRVDNNHGHSSPNNPEFILGGGIYNLNRLTLSNSVVDYNSAFQGGGIFNSGNLTIGDNSQVSHNTSGLNGGGGIYNRGILSASQSVFDQNIANAENGGGIFNDTAGVVSLTDCQVSNNRTWIAGGGVYNLGEFTMLRSRLVDNLAYDWGGGIYSYGQTSIIDSLVDGNTSWNWAGGISSSNNLFISGSAITHNVTWTGGGMIIGGTTRIVNSTISGNYASGFGGAIENYGQLEIAYSTIADNMNETSAVWNGAINNHATLLIGNSIVANNVGADNCTGDVTVTGPNISNDNTCTGFIVADPRLGPLQDNGGPTFTHALLASSPAVDAAVDPNCPATDQRGQLRPQGLACDLGAYEAILANLLIDINPKTSANLIDLTSNSAIPVAILSTPTFNAPRQIVQASLTFGMTGLEDSILRLAPSSKQVCSAADVNGDRLLDLICHFKIKAAGFTCQATRGILRGELLDGTPAFASDAVKITRCP